MHMFFNKTSNLCCFYEVLSMGPRYSLYKGHNLLTFDAFRRKDNQPLRPLTGFEPNILCKTIRQSA